MPADYEKIRTENVARYGWDTAVLDLLGHLYSERTHFIFELIQNAEDAGATDLVFRIFDDHLEVRHDGRPFNEADVRGVCGVAATSKSSDLTKIGRFGIGFKSVYAYTNSPRIYSGDESFRIENYVRPVATEPLAERQPGERRTGDLGAGDLATGDVGASDLAAGDVSASDFGAGDLATGDLATGDLATDDSGTLFVFPFDLTSVPAATAVGEIAAALAAIEPETLLFLRSIKRLRVSGVGVGEAVLTRSTMRHTGTSRRVALRTDAGRADEFLVWQRSVADVGEAGLRVEIAFSTAPDRAGGRRIVRRDGSRLVVYFPTEKQTQLGFLVHGPYRTTPARDNVPEHDPSNQALVRETAELLAHVLSELRDQRLLSPEVLQALPIDEAQFGPGTMFRPLFDSVRAALQTEPLIPVGDGRCGFAAGLKLARGIGLRELFQPDQVGAVYGEGQPVEFVDASITAESTPLLWQYLRDEIGIAEITPSSVVGRLTAEFLEAQPDEWIADLYGFLYGHPGLWQEPGAWGPADHEPGVARERPVIRLEDGAHVRPFRDDGRAAVYLPGATTTPFPAVRRSIASVAVARQFLDALGLTEPDIVDEVLEGVFPRYGRLAVSDLDAAQHEADIEVVAQAIAQAGGDSRARLLDRLRETAFLVGENAATGEQRLMTPGRLYQRSKELELYFDGNADAWFANDGYGPWLVQLRAMGVQDSVQIRARPRDALGYVLIADEFARHERGVEGFDPTAKIDGLHFALSRPSHGRGEYVWNVLLVPNAHLVAGVVETSHREAFVDSQLTETLSTIGIVATEAAWLPGPDGSWHRPAEVRLDQLPASFSRDETLARFLGMAQSVVEAAARQLGLSPDLLRALSEHPDLVALVERELKARTSD